MEVKNKTMFHIHRSNKYDELWQEANEIIIDDNFNSDNCWTSYCDHVVYHLAHHGG